MQVITNYLFDSKAFAKYLEGCKGLTVFDTETTGLTVDANIIGMSFWDFKRNPVFVPTNILFKEGMPLNDMVSVCNKYFPELNCIGHNLKYDLGVIKRAGIKDFKLHMDTISMVHLYNPDLRKKLEVRVTEDLKYTKKTYEEIIGKKWPKTFSEWRSYVEEGYITLKNMGDYAGEDAYWTGKLYKHYLPKMSESDLKIIEKIETPLIYVLRDMHDVGVNVDMAYLSVLGVQLDEAIENIKSKIYEECGSIFNLKSPKQIAEILYDKLKLPCYNTTEKGSRVTDKYAMKFLANQGYEVGKLMVEFSKINTLNQNFVQSIPKLINEDGKLRCNFNIDVARSGRLSCSNPNLQQQPNNKQFPVRKAYIPTPGWKLINADLGQIELRVMAHVSKDKAFHKAFFSGEDIHQSVATSLGVTRDVAKTLNFAIIYGMGPDSLADILGISRKESLQIISGYQNTYSGYYKWKLSSEEYIKRYHCVYNIFGRVRRFDKNPKNIWKSLLSGVNTIIQGSAGDLIKLILIETDRRYKAKKMMSRLLLTVHDELLVEAPINEVEDAYNIMIDCMLHTYHLSVPLEAEGKVIDTWDQMKDKSFKSLLPKFLNNQLINSLWIH